MSGGAEPRNCPICLDALPAATDCLCFAWNRCGHETHLHCVASMFSQGDFPQCPQCRRDWPRNRGYWNWFLWLCRAVNVAIGRVPDAERPEAETVPVVEYADHPEGMLVGCHHSGEFVDDEYRRRTGPFNDLMQFAPLQDPVGIDGVVRYRRHSFCEVCSESVSWDEPWLTLPHANCIPVCARHGPRTLYRNVRTEARYWVCVHRVGGPVIQSCRPLMGVIEFAGATGLGALRALEHAVRAASLPPEPAPARARTPRARGSVVEAIQLRPSSAPIRDLGLAPPAEPAAEPPPPPHAAEPPPRRRRRQASNTDQGLASAGSNSFATFAPLPPSPRYQRPSRQLPASAPSSRAHVIDVAESPPPQLRRMQGLTDLDSVLEELARAAETVERGLADAAATAEQSYDAAASASVISSDVVSQLDQSDDDAPIAVLRARSRSRSRVLQEASHTSIRTYFGRTFDFRWTVYLLSKFFFFLRLN